MQKSNRFMQPHVSTEKDIISQNESYDLATADFNSKQNPNDISFISDPF